MVQMVHLPKGFSSSGVCAGLKASHALDLGLIHCQKPCSVGAVFTQNHCAAHAVVDGRQKTPSNCIQALLVHSGQANAATGEVGAAAHQLLVKHLVERLQLEQKQVLVAGTGIIGTVMDTEKIARALPKLIQHLEPNCERFSQAILTTDTHPKVVERSLVWRGQKYTSVAIAKGSGMIHPRMATLLSFVLTDLPLPAQGLQKLTQEIANLSFNCISVDGDSSTNDSFFLLSSNAAQEKNIPAVFVESLVQLCQDLSKKVVQDGEGAEHVIEIQIDGAPNPAIAGLCLEKVQSSALVKTAIHGADPNWGRIWMALGNALRGTAVDINKISISIQGVAVFSAGRPLEMNQKELSQMMQQKNVLLAINLNQGCASVLGWGCDLSRRYIEINADYTT